MKNFIYIMSILVSTGSMISMEKKINNIQIRDRDLDTPSQPHITIINQLMTKTNIVNKKIDISDEIRTNSYINGQYVRDPSALSISPGKGIRFAPYKNSTLPENKRLGMNNNDDAALIKLYVHAAIKNPLMYLYIGQHSFIKFGDTISFNSERDDGIIMKHNNTILNTINTDELPTIIGCPENREERNKEPLLKE